MNMTPKEIVSYLDDYIIGQKDAKKTIAIALRNRYRRMQLEPELQDEIINYQFTKRVNFAVTETTGAEVARNSLKKESWLETMEKYLEKLAPYLNNYGQYDMLY